MIQNTNGFKEVHTVAGATQQIPGGPVASQVAIKQLGTNGGGFFNTNSAHPFENPTKISDFFELYAITIIPFALAFTFGRMVKDKRQGYAVVAIMGVLWLGASIALPDRRVGRQPEARHRRGDPSGDLRLARREHGGQGGALRAGRLRVLGREHDRHLERLRQLDARQLHADRRADHARPT